MIYYSTRHQAPAATLEEAIMRSEAPDGGLYMPDKLPVIPQAIFNNISGISLQGIAYFIGNALFGKDLPSDVIKRIGDDTFNFMMPFVKLEDNVYALELYHGPTMGIKDIGSRYMARLYSALRPNKNEKLNVMVATNGSTGCAVARGLANVRGVNVFILYPQNVSQEIVAGFVDSGKNIFPIKVNGTIDDCWAMITATLSDKKLNEEKNFTCANSLNIGMVLPQIICYFYAYAQLLNAKGTPNKTVISVPCGSGGNLLAGIFAKQMGLPIDRLVASCNANAAFHHYLVSDKACMTLEKCDALAHMLRGTDQCFGNHATMHTLAYAMDTCCPANLPRFHTLCNGDINKLRQQIHSGYCTDKEIVNTIQDVAERCQYILDPHATTAYKCLKENLKSDETGIVFATGHPAKSFALLSDILGEAAEHLAPRKRYSHKATFEMSVAPTYPALKKMLLRIIG